MNGYSKPKKFSVLYALLAVMFVLACVMAGTGSWFTDSSTIIGYLNRPSLEPTVTVNGSKLDGDNFMISSSSDLTKSVGISFGNVNVNNLMVRCAVSVEVGKIENGSFVSYHSKIQEEVDTMTLIVGVSYTNDWTRGFSFTEQSLIDAGLISADSYLNYIHYYYNDLVTSSSNIVAVNQFVDTYNLLNQGYVFKVLVRCQTTVAGEMAFGTKNNVGSYVGGLWTGDGDEGRATTTWIDSIKNKLA